jgi:hypothetical protein
VARHVQRRQIKNPCNSIASTIESHSDPIILGDAYPRSAVEPQSLKQQGLRPPSKPTRGLEPRTPSLRGIFGVPARVHG